LRTRLARKPKVADADQSERQDVEQEAADELDVLNAK